MSLEETYRKRLADPSISPGMREYIEEMLEGILSRKAKKRKAMTSQRIEDPTIMGDWLRGQIARKDIDHEIRALYQDMLDELNEEEAKRRPLATASLRAEG